MAPLGLGALSNSVGALVERAAVSTFPTGAKGRRAFGGLVITVPE